MTRSNAESPTRTRGASESPVAVWRARLRRMGPPIGSSLMVIGGAYAKEGVRKGPLLLLPALSLGFAIAAGRAGDDRKRAFLWALAIATGAAIPSQHSPWLALGTAAASFAFASMAHASIRYVKTPDLAAGVTIGGTPGKVALAGTWAVAAALWIARIWRPAGRFSFATVDASVLATMISLGVLALESFRQWRAAPLALDVAPRSLVSIAGCGLLAVVTLLALPSNSDDAVACTPVGLVMAAWLLEWAWNTKDGAVVSDYGRRATALGIVGGGAAMLAIVATGGAHSGTWVVIVLSSAVSIGIGASMSAIEEPFLPEQGAWLRALRSARESVPAHDPDDVIRGALEALRASFGPETPSAQVWTLSPCRVATVDSAGYVHEREAEIPNVVATSCGEVGATLRREVLEALQVRRPDLRPMLSWMDRAGARLATAIIRNGEPVGLLVLPNMKRGDAMTLGEVVSAKSLADALAAACNVRAIEAERVQRFLDIESRATLAESGLGTDERGRRREAATNRQATLERASNAFTSAYSAGARFAMDALVSQARAGDHTLIVTPLGTDATTWAAAAHLEGACRDGALIVVDCKAARAHEVETWVDPEHSPLALADGGALCLEDVGALPKAVQQCIGKALSEGQTPWVVGSVGAALDVRLIATSAHSRRALEERGGLHVALAEVLSLGARRSNRDDASVVLPKLEDRAEDMRAIVTACLAGAGMRFNGSPSGIEPGAYLRIVEHHFEGGDRELALVIELAVERASSNMVSLGDLEASFLPPSGRSGEALQRKDRAK